jgi:hypothetical protein
MKKSIFFNIVSFLVSFLLFSLINGWIENYGYPYIPWVDYPQMDAIIHFISIFVIYTGVHILIGYRYIKILTSLLFMLFFIEEIQDAIYTMKNMGIIFSDGKALILYVYVSIFLYFILDLLYFLSKKWLVLYKHHIMNSPTMLSEEEPANKYPTKR